MSPRPADPRIRAALIETAARLLADEGPGALTTRRLAAEVGTSTMAVYTYFTGMAELRHEVRVEGFARLARFLDAVEPSRDPVTYLASLGGAYFVNAIINPHMYRQMFLEPPLDDHREVGAYTLERIVAAAEGAMDAGRFRRDDAWKVATQLWAAGHGIVTIHLAGLMTLDEARETYADMGYNLFIGFGDDRSAAQRSLRRARDRLDVDTLIARARAGDGLGSSPALVGD